MNVYVFRREGDDKAKVHYINVSDGRKLTFSKPKRTLIYQAHVPKYI